MFGLTDDRLSIRIIKSVSGRSFTTVNVAVCGGLGVAIDRLRSWGSVPIVNLSGLFLIRWMIGRGLGLGFFVCRSLLAVACQCECNSDDGGDSGGDRGFGGVVAAAA